MSAHDEREEIARVLDARTMYRLAARVRALPVADDSAELAALRFEMDWAANEVRLDGDVTRARLVSIYHAARALLAKRDGGSQGVG